ncbi:hypothetical protein CBR_g6568 [Chara braunii]|uniref:Zinc finger ZPR1-type domain-containing protein n=1 Tax=Chara braunii TaxID=69332 RepID=A0A388KK53_CHABU|nr:hypothetical protein CBR_g6568 [Chara braunii]|eukprot:GBG70440.1 hypothetical protein CBR_g6568 [Chara braunii]
MSFERPHCGEGNKEIQFAGQLQSHGCQYKLSISPGASFEEDMKRQVVKSDSAAIYIPKLEFEIPPASHKGSLSTIERILRRAGDGLRESQDELQKIDPSVVDAIDAFLGKLDTCVQGNSAFTVILDDPAGNSFIENPRAPTKDPLMSVTHYERSKEQTRAVGFLTDDMVSGEQGGAFRLEAEQVCAMSNRDGTESVGGAAGAESGGVASSTAAVMKYVHVGTCRPHEDVGAVAANRAIAHITNEDMFAAIFKYSAPEEVMVFPSTCGACAVPCETRMFAFIIPYFKEVIAMASTCDVCGYRISELKPGGAIPEKGRTITVRIKDEEDLKRDVIKSNIVCFQIPELELELSPRTLGGLVTTVEGFLTQISEHLKSVHGFSFRDSAQESQKQRWEDFGRRLRDLLTLAKMPSTLILDDLLANSFIAPVTDAMADDKRLAIEEFERTYEQNGELGLTEMDTSAADAAYHSSKE